MPPASISNSSSSNPSPSSNSFSSSSSSSKIKSRKPKALSLLIPSSSSTPSPSLLASTSFTSSSPISTSSTISSSSPTITKTLTPMRRKSLIPPSPTTYRSLSSTLPSETLPETLRPEQARLKMAKALKSQEYSLIWSLLSRGADPDECEENGAGWAPLHWAAKDGNLPIVQLLVSRGADVNIRDKSGQTPLHRAAYWGKFAIVDFLVYVGANIKLVDNLNQTPEEVAYHRNNLDIRHYLQQARNSSTKKAKNWSVKRQFEQLLKDQAKEEKLLKRNHKLEEKLTKLTKETKRVTLLKGEVEKRGRELPKKELFRLERLQGKMERVQEEHRKNNIEITVARAETFEKYAQESKFQTWMAFLEEF